MKLAKLGLIKNVLWKEIKLDYCLKFVLFKIRQIELRSVLLSLEKIENYLMSSMKLLNNNIVIFDFAFRDDEQIVKG